MKILKKLAIGLLASALAIGAVVPAFASNDSSTLQDTTTISYTTTQKDFVWSIPATQSFTDSNLSLSADVSILPAEDTIVLENGTDVSISIASQNNFTLKNGDIMLAYTVSASGKTLAQNDKVLEFIAGASSNTGITQTLLFETTSAELEKAVITGEYSDVVTFTLNITNTNQ